MSARETIVVQVITQALREVLVEFLPKKADIPVSLEATTAAKFGDLTTNLAMQTYTLLSDERRVGIKNPRAWAQLLTDKLQKNVELSSFVAKIEVAGPGFVNFFLTPMAKMAAVEQFLTWQPDSNAARTIIVEYSSPNVAKSFTVGHLRSTVIGDAVANLLEATGNDVKRDNHLGDWGTQFAKQIVAIEKWGNWEEIAASQTPIRDLVALYVKFHQGAETQPELEDEARAVFVQMEQGDEHYLTLWQKIVDMSMKEFDRIYRKLDIHFTENHGLGYGESFARDKTEAVVAELRAKNLLTVSQGAQVVAFAPEDKLPPFLILKKDGSTLYQTRDLAMDKWRREQYGDDIVIINEVGREQSLNFRQLYRVEQLLGWYRPEQRVHVAHGLYRFRDRKMSTRKGDVIWLDDIITAAEAQVGEIASGQLSQQDIETIAMGAIKWNDLSREPIGDIDFDLQAMIALKGNCGPYMQYTVRRCQSVLEKADFGPNEAKVAEIAIDRQKLLTQWQKLPETAWSEEELGLMMQIGNYWPTVERAAAALAPNIVAQYLYALAQDFNNYYAHQQIAGSQARVLLTAVISLVLTQGLAILGIKIPSKM